ncbi:MAG: hypothetical protein P8M17_10245, partial [Saprospiraceae bacterium]|jgi:hypothetical protein|nr:hypothetical protein [Saprospiraceae bacterium]MDG1432598.1 hypothetical protein [Saprospiraceae bacterium]MDG2419362.1 hypothetical protein [Saprospiraceae bacterium]
MSIFSKIRFYFFEAHLNQKLSQIKINRTSVEFDKAKSIGILFDATNSSSRIEVVEYAQRMIKSGKKVSLLGFVKNKQKDLSFSFKYFTLNEVNWKMVPGGPEINQFKDKRFDILINLYSGNNIQIEFISALSKAKLRVGPFSENPNSYDLMIDIPDSKGIDHLIKQIDFFLNRINSPDYEAAI